MPCLEGDWCNKILVHSWNLEGVFCLISCIMNSQADFNLD